MHQHMHSKGESVVLTRGLLAGVVGATAVWVLWHIALREAAMQDQLAGNLLGVAAALAVGGAAGAWVTRG